MTTPLATIADALIEFILSLLRDPAAAAEFAAAPEETLERNGLSDACVDDVRAVVPVIVDRPDVQPRQAVAPVSHSSANDPATVERAISNITNSFHVDNRATIVDQSVNQNIWAHGDVTQLFDQDAIINSGDHGAAAGEDATVDDSDTDVSVGDVSIGNDETNTTIEDSFDDESSDTDTDVDDSYNDGPVEPEPVVETPEPVSDEAPAADVSAPVDVPVDESYETSDDAGYVVDDALPELDDQEQL